MKKYRVICFGFTALILLFVFHRLDEPEDRQNGVSNFASRIDNIRKKSIGLPLGSYNSLVKEVRHVVFLKVHKTGSTSVQNIFIRFGASRNLTFILGRSDGRECNGWPSCISLNETLKDTNIVPSPKGRKYDILCSHVIYNRSQFELYLPQDTLYIALVREPVRRLESSIAHFHLLKRVPLSQYAANPARYSHSMLNNRMALEFGFQTEWFPSETHKNLTENEIDATSLYVQQLMKEFDLILISERLDESLVLMKRMLKWKTESIIYNKKRIKWHPLFDEEDALRLRAYLYLDYILYESAVQQFETKVAESGAGFIEEVHEFQKVARLVDNFCSHRPNSECLSIDGTQWTDPFTVNKQYCNNLLRPEGHYMDKIRLEQYGTLETL